MKIVDFEEIRSIAENMNPTEWFDWVDYVLRHKNDFQMPPKLRMSQENGDYYNVMPAMYQKDNVALVKMVGRHSIKRGEERSIMMSDMMIYEADTGILKGFMDAEYITTLRTGAVAAHSALLFAKKDFNTIGLIGLGNIMTVCFKTMISKLMSDGDSRELVVKLYKYHDHEVRFMKKFEGFKNIKFELCDTYDEVIKDSDLIISAVTRTTEDFASDECYKEGVTIVPICTTGFQNCDLFFDKIFTDEIEQIRGFKYFNQFKSIANVSDVLNGKCTGRDNDTDRILVYDYGISIHDLYFGKKFYELAVGKEIEYNYCKQNYFM